MVKDLGHAPLGKTGCASSSLCCARGLGHDGSPGGYEFECYATDTESKIGESRFTLLAYFYSVNKVLGQGNAAPKAFIIESLKRMRFVKILNLQIRPPCWTIKHLKRIGKGTQI